VSGRFLRAGDRSLGYFGFGGLAFPYVLDLTIVHNKVKFRLLVDDGRHDGGLTVFEAGGILEKTCE